MAFKMKGFTPFTKNGDDEYQKNWKIIQGLNKDLQSYKDDYEQAITSGDTTMANNIKQDIEFTQQKLNERKRNLRK